jgi:hypothetical protein
VQTTKMYFSTLSEAIYNSNMLLNTQQNIRLMFTWRVLLWKQICGVMLFLYVNVVNLWFTDTNVCLNSTASFLSVNLVSYRKTSDWRLQCLTYNIGISLRIVYCLAQSRILFITICKLLVLCNTPVTKSL